MSNNAKYLNLFVKGYLYGGRDIWVPESLYPGHSGRVRIRIQTAFDGKTYLYMTRGKIGSGDGW